jgi:hypothetical protein
LFREEPARFDALDDALQAASYLLKVPIERWLSASRLVHILRSRLAGYGE